MKQPCSRTETAGNRVYAFPKRVLRKGVSRLYATGYIDYYNEMWEKAHKKTKGSDLPKNIDLILRGERYHFANRIYKTHKVRIPRLVIWMKLMGFIKEIKVKYSTMQQPEFNFKEKHDKRKRSDSCSA